MRNRKVLSLIFSATRLKSSMTPMVLRPVVLRITIRTMAVSLESRFKNRNSENRMPLDVVVLFRSLSRKIRKLSIRFRAIASSSQSEQARTRLSRQRLLVLKPIPMDVLLFMKKPRRRQRMVSLPAAMQLLVQQPLFLLWVLVVRLQRLSWTTLQSRFQDSLKSQEQAA